MANLTNHINLNATAVGGGDVTAGDAIRIDAGNEVNVKFDNTTIVLNDNGELTSTCCESSTYRKVCVTTDSPIETGEIVQDTCADGGLYKAVERAGYKTGTPFRFIQFSPTGDFKTKWSSSPFYVNTASAEEKWKWFRTGNTKQFNVLAMYNTLAASPTNDRAAAYRYHITYAYPLDIYPNDQDMFENIIGNTAKYIDNDFTTLHWLHSIGGLNQNAYYADSYNPLTKAELISGDIDHLPGLFADYLGYSYTSTSVWDLFDFYGIVSKYSHNLFCFDKTTGKWVGQHTNNGSNNAYGISAVWFFEETLDLTEWVSEDGSYLLYEAISPQWGEGRPVETIYVYNSDGTPYGIYVGYAPSAPQSNRWSVNTSTLKKDIPSVKTWEKISEASTISYSGGNSGLLATDIQGAIDSLVSTINRLESRITALENA